MNEMLPQLDTGINAPGWRGDPRHSAASSRKTKLQEDVEGMTVRLTEPINGPTVQ